MKAKRSSVLFSAILAVVFLLTGCLGGGSGDGTEITAERAIRQLLDGYSEAVRTQTEASPIEKVFASTVTVGSEQWTRLALVRGHLDLFDLADQITMSLVISSSGPFINSSETEALVEVNYTVQVSYEDGTSYEDSASGVLLRLTKAGSEWKIYAMVDELLIGLFPE